MTAATNYEDLTPAIGGALGSVAKWFSAFKGQ